MSRFGSGVLLAFSCIACQAKPEVAATGPAALHESAPIRLAADSALAAITSKGAGAVLDSLREHLDADTMYFNQISSGDSTWLEVARLLKPVSDGGDSEGLNTALALSLPRSPMHVLLLVNDSSAEFNIEWVCGLPLLEVPDSILDDLRRRSLEALAAVKDPALARTRQRCEAELRKH